LAGYRVPKVVQAKAAKFGVGADRAQALPKRSLTLAARVAREPERIGVAFIGQRNDSRLLGLAERHRARASL
jgi:hypothetical protein